MSLNFDIVRLFEIAIAYPVCMFVFDYGCYFQATIFSTLDRSGRGMNQEYRNPRYHILPHWILWTLAAIGLICSIAAFAFWKISFDFGPVFAVLAGSYFAARYVLMRRGIS